MTFKDRKEEMRVTSIMERIRPTQAAAVDPGHYGKCRVEKSRLFEERLGADAGDIACLTALYLYDQGNAASKHSQFVYETLYGEEIGFRVYRDDAHETAFFYLQEE